MINKSTLGFYLLFLVCILAQPQQYCQDFGQVECPTVCPPSNTSVGLCCSACLECNEAIIQYDSNGGGSVSHYPCRPVYDNICLGYIDTSQISFLVQGGYCCPPQVGINTSKGVSSNTCPFSSLCCQQGCRSIDQGCPPMDAEQGTVPEELKPTSAFDQTISSVMDGVIEKVTSFSLAPESSAFIKTLATPAGLATAAIIPIAMSAGIPAVVTGGALVLGWHLDDIIRVAATNVRAVVQPIINEFNKIEQTVLHIESEFTMDSTKRTADIFSFAVVRENSTLNLAMFCGSTPVFVARAIPYLIQTSYNSTFGLQYNNTAITDLSSVSLNLTLTWGTNTTLLPLPPSWQTNPSNPLQQSELPPLTTDSRPLSKVNSVSVISPWNLLTIWVLFFTQTVECYKISLL